jgi:hypothetical protein
LVFVEWVTFDDQITEFVLVNGLPRSPIEASFGGMTTTAYPESNSGGQGSGNTPVLVIMCMMFLDSFEPGDRANGHRVFVSAWYRQFE